MQVDVQQVTHVSRESKPDRTSDRSINSNTLIASAVVSATETPVDGGDLKFKNKKKKGKKDKLQKTETVHFESGLWALGYVETKRKRKQNK
jgi:hypothetical protein